MGEHNDASELDREFELLFSSLDDVTASEELKQSTLDAVFAELDEERKNGDKNTAAKANDRPHLRLVGDDSEEWQEAEPSPMRAPKKNARGWWLHVAAVVLVVTLCTAGGIAYAMPTAHVLVSTEDATFDLGVNMFGITVSATANTEAGTDAIRDARVHNIGFGDSLQNLLDAYGRRQASELDDVSVTVREQSGNGDDLAREAQQVINARQKPPAEEDMQGMSQEAERTQEQTQEQFQGQPDADKPTGEFADQPVEQSFEQPAPSDNQPNQHEWQVEPQGEEMPRGEGEP